MTLSRVFAAGRTQMRIVVFGAVILSLVLLSYTTSPLIVKHVPSRLLSVWRTQGAALDRWTPYEPTIHDSDLTHHCSERFGLGFVHRLGETAVNHCSSNSSSSFTCLYYKTRDERIDPLCYGTPAVIEDGYVSLACTPRDWDEEPTNVSAGNFHHLEGFTSYWYDTGPRVLLDSIVDLGLPDLPIFTESVPRTYLLVQREGTISNLWHTLMQVMSLGLSIDVLRSAKDPKTGDTFLSANDLKQTQIVITDDHDEGPFWDVWRMYSELPPVRFSNIYKDLSASKVVLPLPGAANTLWEGDWVDLTCEHSALLTGFSRRLLNFYHLAEEPTKPSRLRLTFINRQGSRKLQHQAVHFETLQSAFPDVDMQLVDLAAISFKEQLQVMRNTDILVGVHGAGLTHEFFLPNGSTVVEIQPPDMDHRGFFNMATFLGHKYFRMTGFDFEYENRTGDWHGDDIGVKEDVLLDTMGVAIALAHEPRP
jgi:hypothetical protein